MSRCFSIEILLPEGGLLLGAPGWSDPMDRACMDDCLSPQNTTLPATHESLTHKFCVNGHEKYLAVGMFANGTPGEIFIKMAKEGSTLSGLIQGFCQAFSLALQYGLTTQDAVDRFRGMRFEPMGPTNNPDIPEATSILDYVARFLELTYLSEEAVSGQ